MCPSPRVNTKLSLLLMLLCLFGAAGDPGVCGRVSVRALLRVEDLHRLQERQIQTTQRGNVAGGVMR